MSIQNVFDINVDLKQSTVIKTPIITKNDTVVFNVHVYDDGKVFDISEGKTFSIFSKRSDGQVIGKAGTVTGQNTIQFSLGKSETSVPGVVSATIQIYDKSGRVSTFPFYYQVLDDPSIGYELISTEVTLLQSLINKTQDVIDSANAAVTKANEAASSVNEAVKNATNAAREAAQAANTAAANANKQAELINNLKPLGNYNPDTTYVKNNIVLYNGSSYIAKQTTKGHTPVGDQNDPYWALLARKGVDGTSSVRKVNNKSPDESGNVALTPSDVGAETPSGAQAKADQAEQNAKAYFDSQKGSANGVATLGPDGKVPSEQLSSDAATKDELTHLNLNVIDMAVELETLKGATLNGVTANIFIETFQNLDDINLMKGVYDSINKRLVL